MAAAEDVYVAVSGSAVFYRVNLAVDHQFCAKWYTAHGNRSAGGRCGSARGGSAGPLSGTDGTGAIEPGTETVPTGELPVQTDPAAVPVQ